MHKLRQITAALLSAVMLIATAQIAFAAPPGFTDLPPVADMFLPAPPAVPEFLPGVPDAVFTPSFPELPEYGLPQLPALPVLPDEIPEQDFLQPELIGLDEILQELPEILPAGRLTDLDGHWASGTIMQAFARGMVDTDNHAVRPDNAMTRGEAAFAMERLISNNYQRLVAFGFTYPGAAEPVTGVANNHPFLGSIMALARYGLVGQGVFLPDEAVTRQEMSLLMLSLLRRVPHAGNTQVPNPPAIVARYRDHAQIYDWAREAVAVMTLAGLMSGDPDGNFRPTDAITRAESYTILMNLDRWLNQ